MHIDSEQALIAHLQDAWMRGQAVDRVVLDPAFFDRFAGPVNTNTIAVYENDRFSVRLVRASEVAA